MNENIFRAYDVRGNSSHDLTDDVVKIIGSVLGEYVREFGDNSIYLGHDSRLSKDRIKKKWDEWEESNPPARSGPIGRMLDVARFHIDETGNLDQHLTKELMLEKHRLNRNWKHFGEDLTNLDIEEK